MSFPWDASAQYSICPIGLSLMLMVSFFRISALALDIRKKSGCLNMRGRRQKSSAKETTFPVGIVWNRHLKIAENVVAIFNSMQNSPADKDKILRESKMEKLNLQIIRCQLCHSVLSRSLSWALFCLPSLAGGEGGSGIE